MGCIVDGSVTYIQYYSFSLFGISSLILNILSAISFFAQYVITVACDVQTVMKHMKHILPKFIL